MSDERTEARLHKILDAWEDSDFLDISRVDAQTLAGSLRSALLNESENRGAVGGVDHSRAGAGSRSEVGRGPVAPVISMPSRRPRFVAMDDADFDLVGFDEYGKPSCSLHGAMNKMSESPPEGTGVWRCITTNAGGYRGQGGGCRAGCQEIEQADLAAGDLLEPPRAATFGLVESKSGAVGVPLRAPGVSSEAQIEAAAKSLWDDDGPHPPWESVAGAEKRDYRTMARRALAAAFGVGQVHYASAPQMTTNLTRDDRAFGVGGDAK